MAEANAARVLLVVARDREDLYASLKEGCRGVGTIEVILDRRQRQRRRRALLPPLDRRSSERRTRPADGTLDAVGVLAVCVADGPPAPGAATGEVAPAGTAAFLRGLGLFHELSDAELDSLAGRMRERALRVGEALVREGDPGEEMFFVRRGRLVISKGVTGRVEKVLARVGPGDFFGEMSLIGRRRRSATVRAETEAEVLALGRASLEHLIDASPRAGLSLMMAMVREFCERLSNTDDLVAEVTRWGLEATGLDRELGEAP
jgi:CRP-like cAMP-binding protein